MYEQIVSLLRRHPRITFTESQLVEHFAAPRTSVRRAIRNLPTGCIRESTCCEYRISFARELGGAA